MIFADNFTIIEIYNDIAVILLLLFIIWNYLYPLFTVMGIRNNNDLLFCWLI